MNIDLLREFTTLAIVRNYSDAARMLNISQPTLSRHMITLEKEFGFRLFARTVPVTLTLAGERMLSYVQEVMVVYDGMLDAARSLARNPERTIILQDYSFSKASFVWISQQERVFERKYSSVSIRNVECPSVRSIDALLRDGVLDIAFMHAFDDGENVQLPLFGEGVAAMFAPKLSGNLAFHLRKDNKILSRGERLSLGDIAQVKILSPTERYLDAFRSRLTSFFLEYAGVAPQYDFRQMSSHHYFYTMDPGESAYVGWSSLERKDDHLPGPPNELVLVEFPEYRFATYVVFDEARADDKVRELAELLVAEGED